jgi:hypothetical protein
MADEPRFREDYGERQTEAAHRVLVDVAQVLAAYEDCLVVVGGWVPDLLLPDAEEPHVGSVDVDLALDTERLGDGRYADMLQLLLDTRRYRLGAKSFQLAVDVDLGDGEPPVQVTVDFLASREVKLKKNKPKLLEGFRVLQADACSTAFRDPVSLVIEGSMVSGARNRVRVQVAGLADFLVMKAHALAGRDKPKDPYDLCYILERRMKEVARSWRARRAEPEVAAAIDFLREKFAGPDAYGPQQVVSFRNETDADGREMQARRAYELVQSFLGLIGSQGSPDHAA